MHRASSVYCRGSLLGAPPLSSPYLPVGTTELAPASRKVSLHFSIPVLNVPISQFGDYSRAAGPAMSFMAVLAPRSNLVLPACNRP